jgi:hypothetical protein
MKKALFIIISILPYYFTAAQNTFPSSGNVGIGTTVPQSPLDVNGIGRFTSFNNSLTTGSGVEIGYTGSTGVIQTYNRTGAAYLPLSFAGSTLSLNIGATQALYVNPIGNVGIGTTSPQATLDVNGSINLTVFPNYLKIGGNNAITGDANNLALSPLSSSGAVAINNAANSANLVTVLNNGNVGIGTTGPGTLLTLAKNNVISSNGNDGYISFASGTADNSASGARISMSGVSRTTYGGVLELHTGATGADNNMLFYIGDTEYMRLNNNGNVGIGTASPLGKLQVQTTNDTSPLSIAGSFSAAHSVVGTSASGLAFSKNQTSGGSAYITSVTPTLSWDPLGFQAGNYNWFINGSPTASMVLNGSGNVGIGTISPAAPLEVNGNIQADGSMVTNVASNGNTWFQATTSGTLATGMGSNSSSTANAYGAPSNSSFVGNAQNYPLVFTTSAVEHMRIQPNGNVGIGTTVPDQLLTVLGTIHAKEVNIDLSVPGPDYVFNKDYKLKSLTELNRYVAQNKHLPEIPSAETMEKNGINVGYLNMKLLKKVEELTLYLIEKDKQVEREKIINQAQQKVIVSLQDQLNEIKEQIKTWSGKTQNKKPQKI